MGLRSPTTAHPQMRPYMVMPTNYGCAPCENPVSQFVDEQQRTRYYVLDYDGWSQFEHLVKHVVHALNGIVTERVDGPDARVWTVLVKNHPIVFTHNDMLGNCFFS